MHKPIWIVCAAALLLATLPANADTKFYDVGTGSSVVVNAVDPGLVIQKQLNSTLSSVAFSLNDGQSTSFLFFKIWTNEGDVQAGEDTAPKAITATLDFAVPDASAVIEGDTVGVRAKLFGAIQYGQVTWDGPVIVPVAGDRVFQVSLNDAVFNKGFFGLDEGPGNGACIYATVTQVSSVPVPLPAAAWAGMALLGCLAGARVLRRRA